MAARCLFAITEEIIRMDLKSFPKVQARRHTFKRIYHLQKTGAYSFLKAMKARAIYSIKVKRHYV